MEPLSRIDGPRRSGEFALTPIEVKQLLSKVTILEHEALLRIAIDTGMRREDVVAVKLQDVDLDAQLVRYWEAKKRRVWRAWISAETSRVLAQHIDHLARRTAWLFPSPWADKTHLSSRSAYSILQRYLGAAGLKPRPFHALRATHIKLAQKAGWSIEMVMKQTGDSFRTIKEHYDTPSDDEMAQAARKWPIL